MTRSLQKHWRSWKKRWGIINYKVTSLRVSSYELKKLKCHAGLVPASPDSYNINLQPATRNPQLLTFILFLLLSIPASAQFADEYTPKLTRILFLVDGSGSMKEPMDGSTKFELAKNLIAGYLDSLSRTGAKTETAVRVFGHQFPRASTNCQDSKLEVPFGKHTAASVKMKLDAITPQGWTAIAYSMEQAAKDFPEEAAVTNAMVLITDGLETCGGNPCAVAELFQQKRISLKPFIIGLGIPEDKQKAFDCVGKYYDVTTTATFDKVMKTVVTQAMNATTTQINLLNEFGKPTETNIEVSLHDSYSGALLYNFIHALDEKGFPDTLKLNPMAKYDIIVHSVPQVSKKGVELVAGTHNILAVDVPQGSLNLAEAGLYKRATPLQCIIRENGKQEILMIQDFGTTHKYLTGVYDLEILTLPMIKMKDVSMKQGVVKDITVESPGTLTITNSFGGIASIYLAGNGTMERVYEFKKLTSKETLLLQPGKYVLVTRLNDKKSSVFTRTDNFEISSGTVTALRL